MPRRKNTTRPKKGRNQPTEYMENGQEVWDLVALKDNHNRAARDVLTFLDSEIIPLWLREAVEDALILAYQRRVGATEPLLVVRRSATGEWLGPDKDPKVKRNLSLLFDLTPGKMFTLRLSERARLVQAVKTILDSDLTPVRLYNDTADWVTDSSGELVSQWRESPETLDKILALGTCGFGHGCPGMTDGESCAGPQSHPEKEASHA